MKDFPAKQSRSFLLLFLIPLILFSCKQEEQNNLPDGLYARIETNKGTIITQLEYSKVPVTVANFVSLAEGKNEFVADRFKGKNFYDGLTFHRVVPEFMIQGGDPDGNGSGGPGYTFMDEITNLSHDREGILSMANAGPGTNGSQFFITHGPTQNLDGRHTVFGHVVSGMETVNSIVEGDTIVKIEIIRNGENAKRFDAPKTFRDYVDNELIRQKKQAAINEEKKRAYDAKYEKVLSDKKAYFDQIRGESVKTKSGLQYKIVKQGSGKKPVAGTQVYVHYAGYLEDGHLFDTSMEETARTYGIFDERRQATVGYKPIALEAGRKQGIIPGFAEGIDKLSYGDKAVIFVPPALGYGTQGGGPIPPNASLIFELELIEKTSK